ncbi:hypothetical protein OCT51_12985 [Halomonas sp. LR3S48]|uniref:hypothetical protein n=1 Tax=Halomonas sp. LR3S48 TaxID=2982694 RepID=UPI0021E4C1ED|nr:hypothetical protein [Halomonas sp. LR3S48]UYG05992.1 hypothetical protein OCT51_12985 [Halomonas sp. LR3S48]
MFYRPPSRFVTVAARDATEGIVDQHDDAIAIGDDHAGLALLEGVLHQPGRMLGQDMQVLARRAVTFFGHLGGFGKVEFGSLQVYIVLSRQDLSNGALLADCVEE